MVRSTGDGNLEDVDDANIPVNIFIEAPGEQVEGGLLWTLTADNFMPRRGRVADGTFLYEADTPEELRALVRSYVIPLYKKALRGLEKLAEGKADNFYHWQG